MYGEPEIMLFLDGNSDGIPLMIVWMRAENVRRNGTEYGEFPGKSICFVGLFSASLT